MWSGREEAVGSLDGARFFVDFSFSVCILWMNARKFVSRFVRVPRISALDVCVLLIACGVLSFASMSTLDLGHPWIARQAVLHEVELLSRRDYPVLVSMRWEHTSSDAGLDASLEFQVGCTFSELGRSACARRVRVVFLSLAPFMLWTIKALA